MKRALLLLAAIGIVVIIGLLFRRNNEPTFKGRTLHSWLNNYGSDPIGGGGLAPSRFGKECRLSDDRWPGEAIRALGTNAIGPLLAELNCPDDPPWLGATKRFLDKLPLLKVQFRDAPSRRERAAVAFFDSGSSGISAIPELRQLLTNYSTAVYGAHALAGMGTNAIPGLTAWAFFAQHFAIVPICIFAFIAAHAVGQGTVIWVLISEVFLNRHRAEGQALGSFTHWMFAALLTTLFPKMVELSGANEHPQRAGFIFAFFCFMMFLQLIWVKTMVPETKGITLEQMQARRAGNQARSH